MIGVGDKKPVTRSVNQYLAGEREGISVFVSGSGRQRLMVQQAVRVELRNHLTQQVVEGFIRKFPFVFADDFALGIDKH